MIKIDTQLYLENNVNLILKARNKKKLIISDINKSRKFMIYYKSEGKIHTELFEIPENKLSDIELNAENIWNYCETIYNKFNATLRPYEKPRYLQSIKEIVTQYSFNELKKLEND